MWLQQSSPRPWVVKMVMGLSLALIGADCDEHGKAFNFISGRWQVVRNM